ncbi:MAG: polysaccharide pyruvyl transferase family protein [Brachybacterium sp.]|uniref:polysaccharide pyruvyl transferase family protein n=1 Tax=Brachybacterium sp. TaxID=1891286 RepID=UPI00264A2F99|nr:polysaccharide pyruvyl transferase family protein [Brachybacterium sp.]MDN5685496.1 polysaccharide pyruvyl transferase family protein [Brachybacterium sp.]
MIGIVGNLPRMPHTFPLDHGENAGNMIHARAPQRMFDRRQTIEYNTQPWVLWGEKSYADFVNTHCDHLIVTMANTIWVNKDFSEKYRRFQRMLELYDVPITFFGLGVRSPVEDLSDAWLPQAAIDLLRYMEERAAPIGVRGEFTKQVLEKLAGVTKVQVTGCPSFFSEPGAFKQLRSNLRKGKPGTFAYSGTKYTRPEERALLLRTLKSEGVYIEPTNTENHRAHLRAMKRMDVPIPDYLIGNGHVAAEGSSAEAELGPALQATRSEWEHFFRHQYRLFRNPEDWMQMNREVISHTFGTRFHVNMASLLSGTPATWVTHDSRTRELAEFFRVPHVSLEDSESMTPADFQQTSRDYDEMFDHLPALFDNWQAYMDAHGLPYVRPRLGV